MRVTSGRYRLDVFLVALLLSLSGGSVAANGGPVEYMPDPEPDRGGRGGIQPLEETTVHLVAERLRLTTNDHRLGLWDVQAEYILDNPGPPKTVLFGVPTRWRLETEGLEGIKMGAELIHVAIRGVQARCLPRPSANLGGGEFSQTPSWCVAPLEVPAGRDISLTLEFQMYADEVGRRKVNRLTYPLAPAGFWRGPAQQVQIEIDARKITKGVKLIWPPGAREVEGGLVRWTGTDVDLKKLEAVVVEAEHSQNRRWAGGGWLRASVGLTAQASSTLAPEGRHDYSAAKAVDGNRATAWCEGAKGDGVGESLSVTIAAPVEAGRECRLLDVEIVPGFAANDSVYQANGRVLAGRLERCEDPSSGFAFKLAREAFDEGVWPGLRKDDEAVDGPQVITVPPGALGDDPGCIRLVLTSVRRGKRFADTCVSEFVPRLYCRTSAPAAK